MKINNIHFVNYKGFKDVKIDFNDRLTVIVGDNGGGKTSVLNGLVICFSWIIARIKNSKGAGLYISENEISNGERDSEIIANFDEIEKFIITNRAKSGIVKKKTNFLENLTSYTSLIQSEIEKKEFLTPLPIFAYYGVRRAVIDVPLRAKNVNFSLLDTYNSSLNGDANFKSFFQWYRNQEDIENERIRNNIIEISYSSFIDGKRHMVGSSHIRELNTVRKALKIFLPHYKNIKVQRSPIKMTIEKDGKKIFVDQLSDGEKIYIALIGDLCRKLVLANPTLKDPLQGEGIVLIDEIDLHLHPNWQIEIVPKLIEVFPNVQFIVTTHSPHVINSVKKENIRIIKNDSDNIEISNSDSVYGLPSSIILKDVMGMKNDIPEEVAKQIAKVYELLSKDNFEDVKKEYFRLVNICSDSPELVRIRKIIEFKFDERL
ncbi:MAG: AAA family ATPase [Bacteroidetes bacterium]|nr:AAA family ATPase [Bacteroidota bacterium]